MTDFTANSIFANTTLFLLLGLDSLASASFHFPGNHSSSSFPVLPAPVRRQMELGPCAPGVRNPPAPTAWIWGCFPAVPTPSTVPTAGGTPIPAQGGELWLMEGWDQLKWEFSAWAQLQHLHLGAQSSGHPSWQGQAVETTPGKCFHFFMSSAPSGIPFAHISAQKDPSPEQGFPAGSWPDPCCLPAVSASHLHPRLVLCLPFPSAHKLSALLLKLPKLFLCYSPANTPIPMEQPQNLGIFPPRSCISLFQSSF